MFTTTSDGTFAIFQVNRNTFDVFEGDEFARWSRFELQGKYMLLKGGVALPNDKYAEVKAFLRKLV